MNKIGSEQNCYMDNINKIKVMHLLNTGKFSGAESVAISIIDNTKNTCDSLYVSLDGSIQDVLREKSISFFPVKKITAKNLRKIIKIYKPDLIHAHDYTTSIIAAMSLTKVPIISHLHNNSPWIRKIGIKSMIYAASCLRYKRILAVSDSVIDENIFSKNFQDKIHIIGNPINVETIRKKAKSEKLNEIYDIAFLGRFTDQKNPLVFIDIVKLVLDSIPNLKVCMIGDGDLRQKIEEKILTLRMKDNIILYGFQKNPYSIINNSKILCMPSKWEGFGLGAIEALSLKKPVVCSGVGGLKNIVDHTCGMICGTKKEYVSEICKLLKDKKYYQSKSNAAIKKALQMDNTSTYYQKIEELYKDCINGSKGKG